MTDQLDKKISDMKVSDLYQYGKQLEKERLSKQLIKPSFQNLDNLKNALLNAKTDLQTTRQELTNSTNIITGLSKDLSKNKVDLQQSRLEIQQSRLETQQTRLELLNLKNDSKNYIENLNNQLDELIRVNELNNNNFYQNIVNRLDEHFNREGGDNKRRKLDTAEAEAEAEAEVEVEEEAEAEAEPEDVPDPEVEEVEMEDAEPEEEVEVLEVSSESDTAADAAEAASASAASDMATQNSSSSSDNLINTEKTSESDSERVPTYHLIRGTDSISEIWEEYIRGINGGPSVKELEAKYQYKWRDDKERSILGHRKRIYAMIEKAVENGWDDKEAAQFLDKYMITDTNEKRSFSWLFDNPPDGFK